MEPSEALKKLIADEQPNPFKVGDIVLLNYHGKTRYGRVTKKTRNRCFVRLELGGWKKWTKLTKAEDDDNARPVPNRMSNLQEEIH